ncbi:Receptor-like protein kinase THESEUS 1 [Senna tora]|uniref:Receptor-like protein kinase THESEUS 1 n=1 Tax=Senna tora TaxID=362788 RepID=A0A834WRC2_9FABA|nr:Receptor-like protein kinase THESEUS 1 [Senna tora]
MQNCFGRVKDKKPPPPRRRKCLIWRTLRLKSYCGMLRISKKSSTCKSDVLGRTTNNQVVINWCKGSSSSST